MNFKAGVISLGCAKNQVDTELMLGVLTDNGVEILPDYNGADVIIINTCGFIVDAKKEAIENILEAAEKKREGIIKKIIITGCLTERYKDEVEKEFPEVDGFLGVGSYTKIYEAVKCVMANEKYFAFDDKTAHKFEGKRVLTTPFYSAYLKISEGCDNRCTYCAIPSIRGKLRSRTIESLTKEAQELADNGVTELVIVAQDTTRYGVDIYGKPSLPELLESLCKVEKLVFIRVMYLYPDGITDELIRVFKENDKLINYFDMPVQHGSDNVLKLMGRRGGKKEILDAVRKIRDNLLYPIIRTTVMVGFPGETEEDFEELTELIKDVKFNRLGAFSFSAEEGTKAADMPCQISEDVKRSRYEAVMDLQYAITDEHNKSLIGSAVTVLTEGYDSYIRAYFGRSYMDAPDIDGKIFYYSDKRHSEGEYVTVYIDDIEGYDLIGTEICGKENKDD